MRTKYRGCIIEVEKIEVPYMMMCGGVDCQVCYPKVDRMFSCCIYDKKEKIYSGITATIGNTGACVDEMKAVVDKHRGEQKKKTHFSPKQVFRQIKTASILRIIYGKSADFGVNN